MKRCKWTPKTFDLVNWDSLGAALHSFSNSHQVSLVKLCNDILPMGKLLLHRDDSENPRCALCNGPDSETFAHMLDCKEHDDWRERAKTDLTKGMIELGTPRPLRRTLLDVLFRRLGGITQETTAVWQDCSDIGRLELWRGRLPLSATTMFQSLKRCEAKTGSISTAGSQWSKKLVKLILRASLELWWFRNKKRHGNDREEEIAIRRKRALERCRSLDTRVSRLKKAYQKLFVPLEKLKKWTTGVILHHLAWAETLATKCENETKLRPTERKNGTGPKERFMTRPNACNDPLGQIVSI